MNPENPDRNPNRTPDPAEEASKVGEAPETVPSGDDSNVARVARGAGVSTFGQGMGRALGFITQSVLARGLGSQSFGLYTLGIAVVTAAQIISLFGLDNGVVRYVAHYRGQDDAARVRGTILQAVGFTFAISLVVSAVLFFGAGTIAGFYQPGLEPVIRVFAFALPFYAVMSIVLWSTQGFQTVTYATITQQVLRPLIYFVLLVGLYFVGATLVGVVVAYALSMLAGLLIGLFFLRRLFPPLTSPSAPAKFETKALFAVSVPMSVSRATQYANNWTAVLVLGLFYPAALVGVFQIAFRTATLSTLVRFAFNGIFSPIISNLHSQEMTGDLGRLYKDVTRWTFTGAFAFFLGIVLLASEALTVFGGEEFAAGATALVVVAFSQLYSASVGPANRMLAMTGNQTTLMVITIIGAVTGVAASFAAIPALGLIGAAIGAAAAIVTENTLTLIFVRKRLGFWPYSPAFWKPLTAGIVAAALAYGSKLILPNLPLIPTVGMVGVVFGLVFVALILAFGLTETDREFVGEFGKVGKKALNKLRRRGGARG